LSLLADGRRVVGDNSDEEAVAHDFFQSSFYGVNVERRGGGGGERWAEGRFFIVVW
jgi:hypothetical protein